MSFPPIAGSIPRGRSTHALVTHGHADHARGGHGRTVATPETLAIMELRYQTREGATPVHYGETIRLPGGVDATYVPAGHVLGSAQILLEHAGERVVVTGDYKRRPDPTCPPFEVTPCDVFITEATFGLPVFRHPPIEQEIAKLLDGARATSRSLRAGRRLCAGQGAAGDRRAAPRRASRRRSISTARWSGCAGSTQDFGVDLGELRLVAGAPRRTSCAAQIVVCPPSALNDRWSRRLPDPITAMASGWMRVRQRARQRNVELPLVISDHADWGELTAHDRGSEPGRKLDHPRPRGSAAALVPAPPAPRRGRWRWSATRTRTTSDGALRRPGRCARLHPQPQRASCG